MSWRQTAVEGPAANTVSVIAIPPSLDDYVPSETLADAAGFSNQPHTLQANQPARSEVQSLEEIHLEPGLHIDQYASQLVQLLQYRSDSADALTRAPLIEHIKAEADALPSDAAPQTTLVWQLTDHPVVEQAIKRHVDSPAFGQEVDSICAWFYNWYRCTSPLLHRFVARHAPGLAKRYLLHALSTTETQAVPGLEACLVALLEARSASADFFRLPDLSQPSVHHTSLTPQANKTPGKEGLVRQDSTLTVAPATYSILPAGVAALFGASAKTGHVKILAGVQSWQRSAMAGAALQSFCSWMVTFTDAAIEDFAHVALSLAAAGCPWLQAENQRVLQDELQLPEAQTMHTPQPSSTYRVQLGPEVLDPLCHGLGHAILRLVLAQQQSAGLPSSAVAQRGSIGSTGSSLRPTLSLVAEAVAGLHVRTTYALATDGILLTQALLSQLQQIYASFKVLPGTVSI